MLTCMFLVSILLKVETIFVSDFDVTEVKGINNGLYGIGFATRCRSQGKDAMERVCRHHVAYDLCVCVVASSLVGFVDNN